MAGSLKFESARFDKPSYAQAGWVYAVKGGDVVKIGFAIYPTARFLAAARELRTQVTVLACFRGTKRLERELLEWFSPWRNELMVGRRRCRETFRAAPDMLAFIETLGGIHLGETFAPFIHLKPCGEV